MPIFGAKKKKKKTTTTTLVHLVCGTEEKLSCGVARG
jgi:hypothetical protein